MSERWRSHRDAREALLRRDTAAYLVDRVFPEAPVRQWVLSLSIPLRYRLAYDHKLCSAGSAHGGRAVAFRMCTILGWASHCNGVAGWETRDGDAVASFAGASSPPVRLGDRIEVDDVESRVGEQCAAVQGFSLHAGVAIGGQDRKRIERLCRYISRPPIARERLSELPDGRIAYQLRHRWRDGTTHVVFEPKELLEKLAVLVPWPRSNALRYLCVLSRRSPTC
jgi:hypothetical protein